MAGRAPRGTKLLVIRAGGKVVATHHLRGRRFELSVPLPRRDVTVSRNGDHAGAGAAAGLRVRMSSGSLARHVLAGRSRISTARLAKRVVPLVRAFPGSSAVYVRDLTTGAGAAWNARAHFPAASTLKLAIAVEALRSLAGKPSPGSYADQPPTPRHRLLGQRRRERARGALRRLDERRQPPRQLAHARARPHRLGDVRRLHPGHARAARADPAARRRAAVLRRRQAHERLRPRAALRLHPPRSRGQRPAGAAALRIHARPTRAISSTCSRTSPTAASSTASSAGERPRCTRRAGSRRHGTTRGSSTGRAAHSQSP